MTEQDMFPVTSNAFTGLVTPIPTYPELDIVILAVFAIPNVIVPAEPVADEPEPGFPVCMIILPAEPPILVAAPIVAFPPRPLVIVIGVPFPPEPLVVLPPLPPRIEN